MSWDRRFGKTEGLPNGRIGETIRWPGSDGNASRPSPKATFESVESRVAMRVLVEKAGASGPGGRARMGVFQAVRRHTELKPDDDKTTSPKPKEP